MKIKKVCIVGMGTMGSQIGIVSAGGGYKTSMVDTSEEKVAAGLRTVHFFLENRVKKEKLGREKMDEILDLITAEIDMAKAAGTQI
ncbi:MAG: 3-hydroxyacyl-CoA dehydrogenase NAD-binding domain-containing protein [Desulfomonilaceae bacterium]